VIEQRGGRRMARVISEIDEDEMEKVGTLHRIVMQG
jgi:hypothetical protein